MYNKKLPLNSFTLRLLAMAFMLCDHLWATVVPGHHWLGWVGRLTYPIFAFLLVEGYYHTGDLKKYKKRLLLFALLSEIPYNLLMASSVIWPFQQNVLWTFLLAITCLESLDRIRKENQETPGAAVLKCAALAAAYCLAGQLLMVDYKAYGILMVLIFWLARGADLRHKLAQLVGMVWINGFLMSGLTVPVTLGSLSFDLPQQSAAVLALIPIWLYNGLQGPKNKWLQYGFYAFYPIHILILALLVMY